jgi:hypothetical protein
MAGVSQHDRPSNRGHLRYLKAIPCIEGPKTPADIGAVDPAAVYAFAQLHNDCN